MKSAESQPTSIASENRWMPLSSLFVHLEDVATTRRYPKQAKSSRNSWL
ncbi:hypothetical protein [Brevibacillus choshinensis]|uniref:Uncharacterized protein n=1 Tax=Brevibacillus choshinensis TaxID=54911 RepID=A0ABX7FJS9_BRECH|nr:hypothetical protein [Brevibacillus choshinensis]QRG66120.1 hypothetical protein JNE38_21550 [Brevibacillus choshinensis]